MNTDRFRRFRLLAAAALTLLPVLAADGWLRDHAASRSVARTTWDSVYSVAQSGRGETAYAKTCARCHGASLGGGDEAPAMTGGAFLGNWNGLPISDLHKRIKETMPSDTVGVYDAQLVTDVIAYLLKANGFPAGAADLPNDPEQLKGIVIATERK